MATESKHKSLLDSLVEDEGTSSNASAEDKTAKKSIGAKVITSSSPEVTVTRKMTGSSDSTSPLQPKNLLQYERFSSANMNREKEKDLTLVRLSLVRSYLGQKSKQGIQGKVKQFLSQTIGRTKHSNLNHSPMDTDSDAALAPNHLESSITVLQDHDQIEDIELALSSEHLDINGDTAKESSSDDIILNSIQRNVLLVQNRLSNGDNDQLLMLLLLLNYYTSDNLSKKIDDTTTDSGQVKHEREQASPASETDHRLANAAAQSVVTILTMIEESYHSFLGQLDKAVFNCIDEPDNPSSHDTVPDLLPPCYVSSGDLTTAFFRSCSTSITEDNQLSHKVESIDDTLQQKLSVTASFDKLSPALNALGGIFGKVRSSKRATSFKPTSSYTATSDLSTSKTQDLTHLFKRKGSNPSLSSMMRLDDEQEEQDYEALIDEDLLGMTVENVLERTVVRTVQPGGPAMNAGIKVGSLIVKIGNSETDTMTHFEVIDELRRSQRPLKLRLRCIRKEVLRCAREEMGRLIRGGGFGSADHALDPSRNISHEDHGWRTKSKLTVAVGPTLRFSQLIHDLWQGASERAMNGKIFSKDDEFCSKCGETLVWILCLLAVGLEKERSKTQHNKIDSTQHHQGNSSQSSTCRKEGSEPAKSVSKILHDFVRTHLNGRKPVDSETTESKRIVDVNSKRRKSKQPQPPQHILERQRSIQSNTINRTSSNAGASSNTSDNHYALIQIGDILHRTQTFLADPHCPTAALLRGEVISLLCDILEIDPDLILAKEESASSVSGHTPSPITDLGSAGSLLKLIILHCTWMRSGLCVRDCSSEHHKAHAGNRFLAIVHRLSLSKSTSARVVASSLGTVLWSHLEFPHQLQLRGVLTRALHDAEGIVRKATATVLHEIAELVFDPRVVPWLVLMCERVMTDPDPELRSTAMNLTWHLAEHLPNAFFGDASKGSRSLRRLPSPSHPMYVDAYLLQCKLYPVATRLAEDSFASVRLSVAAQCDRLANALGEYWFSVVIDLLQSLISDIDESVRSAATLCIPRLIETIMISASVVTDHKLSVNVLDSLLPAVVKLIKDSSPDVRIALATASGELLNLLTALNSSSVDNDQIRSKECPSNNQGLNQHIRHIDEILVPILQRLLLDSVPEVTSAALRAVTNASKGRGRRSEAMTRDANKANFDDHMYIPVLTEQQVQRLLPTMSDLATNSQWRVRQSAAEIVPSLVGCTNQPDIRSEITEICFKLMSDPVDEVRKTAVACLCISGNAISPDKSNNIEWIDEVIIPRLHSCTKSSDHKQRLLSLKMMELLLLNSSKSGHFISSSKVRELLQVASLLSEDRVPNVRFNVGRILGNVITVLHGSDLEHAIGILEIQIKSESAREGGADQDVLYFAMKTLVQAKEILSSQKSSGVIAKWLQNSDVII